MCRSVHLLGLLVNVLVAWAVRDELWKKNEQNVFVHLADPQLGMLNQFTSKRFDEEKNMSARLAFLATQIVPKPQFLFLGGDMQNEWPTSQGGKASDGLDQRQNLNSSVLSLVKVKSIPIVCTPGNHDVGDNPTEEDLSNYETWWHDECTPKSLTNYSQDENGAASGFTMGNVLFLQIDSQLYYSDKERLNGARKAQTDWLRSTINNLAGSSIKRIMVLTHIPPFMHDPFEPHGWANWNGVYREEVLKILEAAEVPVMWVCGHFHTLVENNAPEVHKIRVTSAAGTTMWWDAAGHKDTTGQLTPEEAKGVAEMPVAQAFCERIMGLQYNKTSEKCSGFNPVAMKQRMQPIDERSGIRIFHVKDDGSDVKDEWFTLKTLQEIYEKQGALSISALGLSFSD